MLRAVAGAGRALDAGEVRASSGTAVVLGLATGRLEVAPTTAYLMVGERCSLDCAFCAQARSSASEAGRLSRVTWPRYPLAEVVPRLASAFGTGAIVRCCLQVTAGPGSAARTRAVVRAITAAVPVPLCVCTRAGRLGDIAALLELGVERVTVALDAANEQVYNRVKGRGWQRTLDLLRGAAAAYPGHVGTHVMVGLGESEADVATLLQQLHDSGVMVALFAFTPVSGTALAALPPPPEASYRRCQVARHLIVNGIARAEQFRYSAPGEIISYGLAATRLEALLRTGDPFRTSGCPGCNRPFYNERPGGPLYNYPRPLRPGEAAAATALVMAGLADR
ncbi:MAG: radical SAM protein [Anaerolineae bacterium]|nr:radical SAM protein [Anaerolineae bacterium]